VVLGESIAVNGACMTVTAHRGRTFTVEVSPESIRQTTLGGLAVGARLNLERALRAGDRLGGHFVQGHVDGIGKLVAITPDAAWSLYRFQAPASVAPYLVEKGSIAVNGVSLTVFSCRGRTFTVALIPHTLGATNLADLRPGDPVNVESDILLKHVANLVRRTRRRR
jgi:riboflavin synthase